VKSRRITFLGVRSFPKSDTIDPPKLKIFKKPKFTLKYLTNGREFLKSENTDEYVVKKLDRPYFSRLLRPIVECEKRGVCDVDAVECWIAC
jgi:hypothetical protein